MSNDHNYYQNYSFSTLVRVENRGGLVCSEDVQNTVKYVETLLKLTTDSFNPLKSGLSAKNYVYKSNIF